MLSRLIGIKRQLRKLWINVLERKRREEEGMVVIIEEGMVVIIEEGKEAIIEKGKEAIIREEKEVDKGRMVMVV